LTHFQSYVKLNIITEAKARKIVPCVDVRIFMSKDFPSAGFFLARYYKTKMSIKSTIAAVAASPFLFAGAAFAGPYVNLEASGSYPDGAYDSGALEAQVGYEGATESGIGWYVSGGPTVTHTEAADEFGDVEFIGYVGGSYDKFYGELSAVTAEDDIDWGAKAGVKFTF